VPSAGATAEFERQRPRLRGLAYRMLGSVADADDVLQDAYMRWHGAAEAGVREPAAWLTTAVTRLCIDRLRAARVEREAYAGPWLPEPWLGDAEAGARPDRRQDRADDLSIAFLLLLERLAPEERAALLLHDVFELGYPQIAAALEKSEAACRQAVHRARERVRSERRRFAVTNAERRQLLDRFLAATRAGDDAQLLDLLAPAATLTSDGGGKAWAARKVIHGAGRIARLLLGVARKAPPHLEYVDTMLNGEPAVVTRIDGRPHATLSIDVEDGRIVAIWRVMNPDKLIALENLAPPVTAPSPGRQ